MSYNIEISRQTMTAYDPGSGEWLDGDVHVIADHGTVVETFDYDDAIYFDGPVEWAVERISRTDATEPSESPIPNTLQEHAWLLGRYDNPYTTDFEETTIRLTGDFTVVERAEIFRKVTA